MPFLLQKDMSSEVKDELQQESHIVSWDDST